jgi:hypothetical protein
VRSEPVEEGRLGWFEAEETAAWQKNPAGPGRGADDVMSSAFFGFMTSSRGKVVRGDASGVEEAKKRKRRRLQGF